MAMQGVAKVGHATDPYHSFFITDCKLASKHYGNCFFSIALPGGGCYGRVMIRHIAGHPFEKAFRLKACV